MNSELYTELVQCPICEKEFSAVMLKPTAYTVEHTDEDFCVHYKGLNPKLYEVLICKHCGYAEKVSAFGKIAEKDMKQLEKLCLTIFTNDPLKPPFELNDYHKRVYSIYDSFNMMGERDNLAGIETYKILLSAMEARQASSSDKAKVVLEIAWIYRMMNDPLELAYLEKAADLFAKAFEVETFESKKLDSATCAYMAGELYRRTENLDKGIEWFRKALSKVDSLGNSILDEKIRNQLRISKNAK